MLTEVQGDLWDFLPTHLIVIPTNTVGVMGRGLAAQARDRFPGLETAYRAYCQKHKSGHKMVRSEYPVCLAAFPQLILFPVKRHWGSKADLDLIRTNLCRVQSKFALEPGAPAVALPELGCGFGELTWKQVRPLFEILQDSQVKYLIVHPEASLGEKYASSFQLAKSYRDARFPS